MNREDAKNKLKSLTKHTNNKLAILVSARSVIDDIFDRTCKWTRDIEFAESECGFSFAFSDDRSIITDYDFNYCPKCGGKIKVK